MPHAVSRLRTARLATATKPFVARGSGAGRCERCRLFGPYCICDLQPAATARAGVCLLMGDIEAIKPSNTGWLIADLVADTHAFAWSRTVIDPALIALLNDPQWQPFVVFPGEFVDPARVVTELAAPLAAPLAASGAASVDRRPLFVLLDGTWSEARKMFNKSRYLDGFPVLSLRPDQASNYRLRRSECANHLCTAEVAALCLQMAGDDGAADALSAWLAVFTEHYLKGKQNRPVDRDSPLHQRLRQLHATHPGLNATIVTG